MADLLSGLGSLGLGNLENMDLFADEKKEAEAKAAAKAAPPKVEEKDFLFDKTYTCPVCGKEFKCKTLRSGKARLLGTDQDFRPRYENIDPLKYDILVCTTCGYAALPRYFNSLVSVQRKAIMAKIGASFKNPFKDTDETYSYEVALERYKLALVNTIVKSGKASEKAYICLKTAWLLRGHAESLDQAAPDYAEKKKALEAQENEFLKNALDGFVTASTKEEYPMAGMDETTVDLLTAVLAVRFGQKDLASRLISSILTSSSANSRMKDRARDLRDEFTKKA
ncbi:MAG: DUF2225 domain-containing protein [Lachnospiraceae bacterium]|nr:DUF2225 domain-containing protein [Lachnospiraceae bacterium]